jgi:phenylalanyl-tRNA synthetase beta chain
MTNQETLFTKMKTEPAKYVELANPKVITMNGLRNQLLPGLMEFLSVNQSVEFPQKIFELGKVTLPDALAETRTRDENWLSAATTHPNAGFSEIKSALDSFMANFGAEWMIKETSHPCFMEGRVGEILVGGVCVGYVGEISPAVLEAWKLENPAAAFELHIQTLIDAKLKKQ